MSPISSFYKLSRQSLRNWLQSHLNTGIQLRPREKRIQLHPPSPTLTTAGTCGFLRTAGLGRSPCRSPWKMVPRCRRSPGRSKLQLTVHYSEDSLLNPYSFHCQHETRARTRCSEMVQNLQTKPWRASAKKPETFVELRPGGCRCPACPAEGRQRVEDGALKSAEVAWSGSAVRGVVPFRK